MRCEKLNDTTFSSTFLTPAGGTVNAAAWSFDDRVEWRATILNLTSSHDPQLANDTGKYVLDRLWFDATLRNIY